ncbi:MAG: hypothetical protein M3376_01690 [Actinomycetota bacterium]|nr:hypothetical protein [Actinomycetota bacterium]
MRELQRRHGRHRARPGRGEQQTRRDHLPAAPRRRSRSPHDVRRSRSWPGRDRPAPRRRRRAPRSRQAPPRRGGRPHDHRRTPRAHSTRLGRARRV